VICCCLISNMAAFNFSNWAQATAVRVIHRDGKPYTIPVKNTFVKHCKEIHYYKLHVCLNQLREIWATWDPFCGYLSWITPAILISFILSNAKSQPIENGALFLTELNLEGTVPEMIQLGN
jgi:hypothetical protein